MAQFIKNPTIVPAAGHPPKTIEEYIGRVNSNTNSVSIARMQSPGGWVEPGQVGQFTEYTIVLKGTLHLKLQDQDMDIDAGQAVIVEAGEWVQYSSPTPEGAEYIAVSLPAFAPDIVTRNK